MATAGSGPQVGSKQLCAGLFDPAKETDRLRKQEAKVQKALAGLQGRLANRSFLDNAAPAVVQEVRQQQVGCSVPRWWLQEDQHGSTMLMACWVCWWHYVTQQQVVTVDLCPEPNTFRPDCLRSLLYRVLLISRSR